MPHLLAAGAAGGCSPLFLALRNPKKRMDERKRSESSLLDGMVGAARTLVARFTLPARGSSSGLRRCTAS